MKKEIQDRRKQISFADAGQSTGRRNGNIISELLGFLSDNKKWWLLPILIALLAVSAIVVLAASGAAPFIYSLF